MFISPFPYISISIFNFCNISVEDIDGGYGEWSEWSECSISLTCQRGGFRTRTRECDTPEPQA